MGPARLQRRNKICLRVEQVKRKKYTPQRWEQTAKWKDWGGGEGGVDGGEKGELDRDTEWVRHKHTRE